jgi:Zn-dependent oligopeptidase
MHSFLTWALKRCQSQFLEEHLFDPRILKRFAVDKDGKVIPEELINKLEEMQQLDRGMATRTQLAYARL